MQRFPLNSGASAAIYGKFPVEIIGAHPVGGAIGGLIPSLLNVAILGLQTDQPNWQLTGFICFTVSTVIYGLNVVVFLLLMWNRYFLSFKTSLTHPPQFDGNQQKAFDLAEMGSRYKGHSGEGVEVPPQLSDHFFNDVGGVPSCHSFDTASTPRQVL